MARPTDIPHDAGVQAHAARMSYEGLVKALDSMTDAFYLLDPEWRFTYLNKEAERLLQRPAAALLGKVIWDQFPRLAGSAIERELREAREAMRPAQFEEFYAPFGSWKELRVFPSPEGVAVYFTDIAERKRLQEAQRESEERFMIVARATTDVVWEWDLRADNLWWSEGMRSVFGYAPGHFDGGLAAWSWRIDPAEQERVVAGIWAAVNGTGQEWHAQYRFRRNDGSYALVQDRGFIIRDQDGKAVRMIGAMVDITERKEAESAREEAETRARLQASLLDKAQDAITVTDLDMRVTYWNKGAERLLGWSAQEAMGKLKSELLNVGAGPYAVAHEAALRQGDWIGEISKRRKDGRMITSECHFTLVRDDHDEPVAVLEIETDVTHRLEATRKIEDLAFFDPLTGLANRRLLLDRLQHALAKARRTRCSGALLFIDLDNFKSLNDTLGHDKGDLLLQQVARRLETCVLRGADTVARLGGDEFVLMLEDLSMQPAEAAAHARMVGEKILAAFVPEFDLDGHERAATPSIGVALFDHRTIDVDTMLKRADLAMYQSKAAGRNTVRFFDPGVQTVVAARIELETELRQGLREHEFMLYYQRQADNHGRTIGAEALVRWRHPRRGLVSPGLFIPLAEETGLILHLGRWILDAACRQLALWAASPETADLTLSVNVSARQFRQGDFVDQVKAALARSGANPRRLKLELTESMLAANVESMVEKMLALRAGGVGFALDDFGTGYSSLAYLIRLPLDQIKIDQSFVRDVLTDRSVAAIACTIVALGHTLGLNVIAEGVETQGQRDFLQVNGCNAYQGYLFSPPVPADQFDVFQVG